MCGHRRRCPDPASSKCHRFQQNLQQYVCQLDPYIARIYPWDSSGLPLVLSEEDREPMERKPLFIPNGNLIAELRDLEEDTEYCIQLAGITRIGDGNRTDCLYVTTEKAIITIVPQPSSEGSFSPSAIKVTWTLPSKNQGIAITGFYLHIKEQESSSPKPKALFENIITLANASQTSLVIRNLSVLTKYQVQMAANSGRKVGNYSSPIIAETCRCPKYLPSATRPSPLEREGKSGIASVIADVVKKTCGTCREHGQTELIPSNTSDIGDLSGVQFPVALTSLPGESSFTFVPVLNVPGLVVLKRRGDKAAQKFYERVITDSVMGAWPVLAASVLMFYNMGAIVWFLDAKENPKQDELSWSFVKGAYEGSWWAFVTMTTVGYGDQCVKSVRARLFALLWIIASLVSLPFLTGAISSILTVSVLETKLTVPKSDGSAATAAAITNSSEAKLAMGRLSNKLKLSTEQKRVFVFRPYESFLHLYNLRRSLRTVLLLDLWMLVSNYLYHKKETFGERCQYTDEEQRRS
ncbi:uncharacterized protein LOC114956073 isoform X1 [Acropora millepora]|uniref:uncharacterized protein LOC114956073 isoform X1 n=2 Tax=Acropora millepora TaxID=45264 RepID=UPI001CF3A54C|nr:uncharacterized protein LOC114956073 isoform X1 [Acropora millepora]